MQACHTDPVGSVRASESRETPKLPLNSDASAVAAYIDSMYLSSSRALVLLLMDKFKLMESLQTVRRYFLLDQGDFLMHFLDSAEDELQKDFENLSAGRVQHLLSICQLS